MGTNQYGRRTWDVEEYAAKAQLKDTKAEKVVLTNDQILNQINSRTLTKSQWFNCEMCQRRFKDSLQLSDHLSSAQHLSQLEKIQPTATEKVDLAVVKTHLRKLHNKLLNEGWLEGLGFGGSQQERMQRQEEINTSTNKNKKQKVQL